MGKDESNVLGGEIHVSGIPNSGPKKVMLMMVIQVVLLWDQVS